MLQIRYNEIYQLFFLKQALLELPGLCGISESSLVVDHKHGTNKIAGVQVPVTFPQRLKNRVARMDKIKSLNYVYIGTVTPRRAWILPYASKTDSVVRKSLYGRTKSTKYTFDTNYYQTMCRSRFTLTPTDEYNWSYRFFEAILCLSIPVVEKNSPDKYHQEYHCVVDGDEHTYNADHARANYEKFIQSTHFLLNVPEITQRFCAEK